MAKTPRERAFDKLKGVSIKSVDATCVNEITIVGEDGNKYVISTELGPLGIGDLRVPIMSLTKYKEAKVKKPEPARPTGKNKLPPAKKPKLPPAAAWPYPPPTAEESADQLNAVRYMQWCLSHGAHWKEFPTWNELKPREQKKWLAEHKKD